MRDNTFQLNKKCHKNVKNPKNPPIFPLPNGPLKGPVHPSSFLPWLPGDIKAGRQIPSLPSDAADQFGTLPFGQFLQGPEGGS